MKPIPPCIAFVCTGNAGRSQIAAALAQRALGTTAEVVSAGVAPWPNLHPMTRPTLQRRGVVLRGEHPKPVSDICDRGLAVIVTIGDPARAVRGRELPGNPLRIHWDIADPADADGTPDSEAAFERAAQEIEQRLPAVRRLVPNLPTKAAEHIPRVEVGIGTVVLKDIALEAVLEKIASAGFRRIELLCEEPHFGTPEIPIERLREQLDLHGLSIETAHGPYIHIDCGAEDEQRRQHAVNWIASFFAPMTALGAQCIVVHPNQHLNRSEPHKNRVKTQQSLRELADRAMDSGIRIAVENVPFYKGRRTGDSVAELLEIVHDLPPNVGICLDTGHAVLAGRDPVEELKLGAGRIVHLHLQDNDGTQDRHWVPGDGVIAWDQVIATMRQIQFSGSATIEVVARSEDPGQMIDRSQRLAQRWKGSL